MLDRHDGAVRLLARRLRADCGALVAVEQRRSELDRVDAKGEVHRARLDLIVTLHGEEYLVDVTFTDVRTVDAEQLAARLRWDGVAARRAEDGKRHKYPAPNLVPLAIETGGRIGAAGLDWLRRVCAAAEAQDAWQSFLRELSAHTQAATAASVTAAVSGA